MTTQTAVSFYYWLLCKRHQTADTQKKLGRLWLGCFALEKSKTKLNTHGKWAKQSTSVKFPKQCQMERQYPNVPPHSPSNSTRESGRQRHLSTEVVTALHWCSASIFEKRSFFNWGAVLCSTHLSGGIASSRGSFENMGECVQVTRALSSRC